MGYIGKFNSASSFVDLESPVSVNSKTVFSQNSQTDAITLSADEVNVGSNALVVDSSRNVGIGTTPGAKLDVSGAGFEGGAARFTSTNSGNSITIQGVNGSGINDSAFIVFKDGTASRDSFIGLTGDNATGGAGSLRFGTGNFAEHMRITSSGNVGIATSSPSAKLDVLGGINMGNPSSSVSAAGYTFVGGINFFDSDYMATFGTHAGHNNSRIIQLKNHGRSGTAGTVDGRIGLQAINGSDIHLALGTESSHPTSFYTNGAERMRIDSSGNVKINGNAQLAYEQYTYAASNFPSDGSWYTMLSGLNGHHVFFVRMYQEAGGFHTSAFFIVANTYASGNIYSFSSGSGWSSDVELRWTGTTYSYNLEGRSTGTNAANTYWRVKRINS